MAEKIQETDEGYYIRSGDVLEWRWKKDEPKKAEPEKKAEPKKVTTKTAEPLVHRK
jgi:hypothetical protein